MSLNFDFGAVHNYKEVTTHPTDPELWHPVADALVWLSMICGYDRITLKNVDKVIARVMAYQAVTGGYLGSKGTPIYIMPADVRRFVGLQTNASTLTDAQWFKRLGTLAQDQGHYLQHKLENAQTPSALQLFGTTHA